MIHNVKFYQQEPVIDFDKDICMYVFIDGVLDIICEKLKSFFKSCILNFEAKYFFKEALYQILNRVVHHDSRNNINLYFQNEQFDYFVYSRTIFAVSYLPLAVGRLDPRLS